MNLTLRQLINNIAWAERINKSKIGQRFQNSNFAKHVEAGIYIFNHELSNYVSDGLGVVDGIMEGFTKAVSREKREYYVQHRV